MNETKIYSSPAIAGTIEIHKNDITKLKTDAVVNAANSGLRAGGGVCGAIFRAVGTIQLQEACDKIGYCPTGSAVITPAFGMKNNKYIIHAVGPRYDDGNGGEISIHQFREDHPAVLITAVGQFVFTGNEPSCKTIQPDGQAQDSCREKCL